MGDKLAEDFDAAFFGCHHLNPTLEISSASRFHQALKALGDVIRR